VNNPQADFAATGVVDENQYLPTADAPAAVAENPKAIPAGFRQVTLVVPDVLDDQILETVMHLGQAAYKAVLSNKATMIYPALVQDKETGQVGRSIGKSEILLNTKSLGAADADVKLLLDLGLTIHQVNVAGVNAAKSGKAMEQLDVATRGEHMKKNAYQDTKAQAKGEAGGIIIATK
jgi:hypothetical protein